MSNNRETVSAQWRHTLAGIEARVEDLKIHSDMEYHALHSRLDAQIAALQQELKKLASEVAMAGPDAYMQNISTQLDELKAKGDAAYELIQKSIASRGSTSESEQHDRSWPRSSRHA